MQVYFVGQHSEDDSKPWEIQGVFSSHDKAVAACYDDKYFILELEVDKELPRETSPMDSAFEFPTFNRSTAS